MSNPIQDFLNIFKKPVQTASGTAGGSVGHATPSSSATLGSQTQRDALAKKTNQDIINAAYKVADQLKLKGGPWPLLRAAGWGRLTEKRGDLYKGKFIDDIDGLTLEQKTALKNVLGI
jgi:hypothetical protein